MHYTLAIFDIGSGEINRVVECPEDHLEVQAEDGEGVVIVRESDSVQDDTHYVENGEIRKKSIYSPSIEVSGLTATIADIPEGVMVSAKGASCLADGGLVEIEFDAPGRYHISLTGLVEYKEEFLEVTIG